MNRIALKHLTFVGGDDREPATVDFSPRLSVIHGASDTGKSFVGDAIDYMLGASSLRQIHETEGYYDVLLGLESEEGPITLARAVSGGQFRLFNSMTRDVSGSLADQTLGARHVKGKSGTISNYLLGLIDLDGRTLRKNLRNEVVALSFRNLARLCLIHEDQMVSTTPPIFSGQYVNKTTELSTFRLLLDGEDDSSLPPPDLGDEARKISKGKFEILQQVLTNLRSAVEGAPSPQALTEQLSRIAASIEEQDASAQSVIAERDALLAERDAIVVESRELAHRVSRMLEIVARFDLLRAQYESDLGRLAAIQEAGNLLGFFRSDECVFCGATSEHQNPPGHAVQEAANFSLAIAAEAEKTSELLADLTHTISDLREQLFATEESRVEAGSRIGLKDQQIRETEERLQPHRAAVAELYGKKSAVEQALNNYAQIARIEELASNFQEVPAVKPAPVKRWPSSPSLHELSNIIMRILTSWGIPHEGSVSISTDIEDLVVDGRPRSTRGKGMRSILHTAFTLGLAEYCLEREMQHPGFVVLDSPLVTYREADSIVEQSDEDEDDFVISQAVATAFYRYVDTQFPGQVVVIENTPPPGDLSESAEVESFTQLFDFGRYGFFPVKGGLVYTDDSESE